ncbi:MAG: ATP-binding cassette domain-containing protein [Synergistaceae bacterium]|jgi:alpha-D-ribose 1-methylphosphonate 5-triphosphate synthase subunit PhnL|nr:ATP-binding cassette domain-containing protein [Synergistaceae bacterium]
MLAVKNLRKDFTMFICEGKKIPSFGNVSFEVGASSLLAITGPSGAGKSSLLKCVYRTYLPTEGEILYLDRNGGTVNLAEADDWVILSLRRNEIGYVSQFFHAMPRVSALDTLIEPLITRGGDAAEAMDRASEMLSSVGIGKALWDMYPSTFSGGEKQRLNILRAVITKPRLLLLDEPTASLDRGYKERIMNMILALKEDGTAMLGVFHDRDALTCLSDARYEMTLGEYCEIDRELFL